LTLRALGAAVLLVTAVCLADMHDGDWNDEMLEVAVGQAPTTTNSFQEAITASKEGGLDLDSKPSILSAQNKDWAMKKAHHSYKLPKPKISFSSLLERKSAFARAAARKKRKSRRPKKAEYVVAKKKLLKRPGYTWQCVQYRKGYFKALRVAKSHKKYSEYAYKARAKARRMRVKLAKVEAIEKKFGRGAAVKHKAAEMKKKLRARALLRRMREVRQKRIRAGARELRGKKARERMAKKRGQKKFSLRLLRKIRLALRARNMRRLGANRKRKDRRNEKSWKGKVKELNAKVRALKGRQWKKKFDYSKVQRQYCVKWAWVRIEDYHRKKKMIKNRWRPSGPRHAGKIPIKNIVHRILKVQMTVTLVRNVLHLKAYCLGAHRKLLNMKRSSQLSALGHFLYRYGKRKGSNNVGEYVALYRSFMKYYNKGIDKYLIDRLHAAMQDKSGILSARLLPFHVEGIPKRKPAMMLKHRDLGLQTLPRMFVKMALPVSKYQSLLRTVRKTNKITVASAQFEADGCRCTGRPSKSKSPFLRNLGKTCKKWFGYDKKPWCFVNKKCHHAVKAADGGLFKYC